MEKQQKQVPAWEADWLAPVDPKNLEGKQQLVFVATPRSVDLSAHELEAIVATQALKLGGIKDYAVVIDPEKGLLVSVILFPDQDRIATDKIKTRLKGGIGMVGAGVDTFTRDI